MINFLKEYIRAKIYKRYNISFSKSGEDIQLKQLLKVNRKGVYVDIGCWDPVKASNSYYFHLRGWKGICIDPNPKMKELFEKKRKTDIFVNKAIGTNDEILTYYLLEDQYSSMNTLDYSFIQQHHLEDKIVEKKEVQTISLKSVLEQHISPGERIDFLDIDVEGFDLMVLASNDWEKFRPKVILIETDQSLSNDISSEITLFLSNHQYALIGKSVINGNLGNLFYIDKNL
jgi:FkbM family methyltransferase